MGFLDRARSLFSSPATRRLEAAAAEAWGSAPRPQAPSLALAAANTPPIDWRRDQPQPPPRTFTFTPNYSDHTYQNFSAPLGFEGFGLDRIRSAVAQHRLGMFLETSSLCVSVLGFSPVLAALKQRVAPILGLARHVHGGDKGLARLVASEIEEQLAPRGGLLPTPYLAPQLWGTLGALLAFMSFAVLQHVDGDMDPETGVRPRFTRLWPVWATNIYRSPRKVIALTSEGPVEVCNDGKFTLVADEEEPHLSSAICCLGDEALGGKITQEQRASFLDFFGKPKLWATPPEKIATYGPGGGDAFAAAVLDVLYGPDGRAVLPHGSEVKAVSITGEGAQAFQGDLLDRIVHIFMVLTGSAGTIGNGVNAGAGPYQPAKNGPWNVLHSITSRDLVMIVRALNQGHIAPYCDMNYAEAIARAKRVGTWKYPVLSIPIPAPDRDERIAAEITRQKAYTDQITADRAAGGIVDQARADKLAERFEALPITLADPKPKGGEIFAYHYENKLVAPDEGRDRLGLPPLPKGAGSVERLAEERLAGGDKPGALAKAELTAEPAAPQPAPEPSDGPTTKRSTKEPSA